MSLIQVEIELRQKAWQSYTSCTYDLINYYAQSISPNKQVKPIKY